MQSIMKVIFRLRLFPVAVQGVLLAGCVAVIWFSMGVVVPPGAKPKVFAQSQLATLLVWGIWLPLLIVATVFFGRVWCAVCPLELVQKTGSRLGKKVFQKTFFLPKLLRTGITGVLVYSFLLYSVIAMRLPQIPGNLATLLIFLFAASLLMIAASVYSCMEMKNKRSGGEYRLVMVMALLCSIFIITPKLSALL